MKILQWDEIADNFKECLVIGNGASIAVDPEKFTYQSLYNHAYEKKLITEQVDKLFKYFGNDFEYVLRMLMYATEVNRALKIKDLGTEKAYADTRMALIETVRNIHPEHKNITEHLPRIAKFIGHFKTVISLNYDLLIYWAILSDHRTGVTFKDCFISGDFDDDWERFREKLPGEKKVCLVFYPHGSLLFCTSIEGSESKISNEGGDDNLLENIIKAWESEEYIPLFVSEGTAERKLQRIEESRYLRTIYEDVLFDNVESVTVYGWSMTETDDHLLDAIAENPKLKRLAISVYTADSAHGEKCAVLTERIKKRANKNPVEIMFFDSLSENCWIHSNYVPVNKILKIL